MLTRPLHHLRRHVSRNVVAYLALFIALGGTGYAATNLPAQSVGAAQLRDHSISPVKLDPSRINGNVRAWAIVRPSGHVIAGGGKPRVGQVIGFPGRYTIRWGVNVGRCDTAATIDLAASPPTETLAIPGDPAVPFTAGYAVASTSGGRAAGTFVQTYSQAGQPTPLGFDVTVVC